MSSVRIGDLLLKKGIVTRKELETAIEYQSKFGGRLGDIVAELFNVDREMILRITDEVPVKGRLGEMLVNTGQISQEQLDRALEFQQKSGGVLGDILLSLRFIEPDRLYRAIATQNNIGRIGTEFSFEKDNKLPEAMARSYNAVIINRDFNRYLVAVSSILSPEQIEELELYLGSPIEQVMATREEMEFFWKEVYIEELMQESTEKLIYEKPENSAHITFTSRQSIGIYVTLALFIGGLFRNWLWTLLIVNIIVQIGYLIMSVFK